VFVYFSPLTVSSNADPGGVYNTKEWLERIVIIGINNSPSSITITSGSSAKLDLSNILIFFKIYLDNGKQDLRFKYNPSKKILEIKRPGLNISKDFVISLS